jgi:hypothetical protein
MLRAIREARHDHQVHFGLSMHLWHRDRSLADPQPARQRTSYAIVSREADPLVEIRSGAHEEQIPGVQEREARKGRG